LTNLAWVVAMLTTAGEARLAAGLKLPGITAPIALGAASSNVTPATGPLTFNQSGFKVATTNQIAKQTVTTCENNNQ
jgi:hypothetical protein